LQPIFDEKRTAHSLGEWFDLFFNLTFGICVKHETTPRQLSNVARGQSRRWQQLVSVVQRDPREQKIDALTMDT